MVSPTCQRIAFGDLMGLYINTIITLKQRRPNINDLKLLILDSADNPILRIQFAPLVSFRVKIQSILLVLQNDLLLHKFVTYYSFERILVYRTLYRYYIENNLFCLRNKISPTHLTSLYGGGGYKQSNLRPLPNPRVSLFGLTLYLRRADHKTLRLQLTRQGTDLEGSHAIVNSLPLWSLMFLVRSSHTSRTGCVEMINFSPLGHLCCLQDIKNLINGRKVTSKKKFPAYIFFLLKPYDKQFCWLVIYLFFFYIH